MPRIKVKNKKTGEIVTLNVPDEQNEQGNTSTATPQVAQQPVRQINPNQSPFKKAQAIASTALEPMAHLGAGMVRGATGGLINPYKGQINGQPMIQPPQDLRGQASNVAGNIAGTLQGAPGMLGNLASKAIPMTPGAMGLGASIAKNALKGGLQAGVTSALAPHETMSQRASWGIAGAVAGIVGGGVKGLVDFYKSPNSIAIVNETRGAYEKARENMITKYGDALKSADVAGVKVDYRNIGTSVKTAIERGDISQADWQDLSKRVPELKNILSIKGDIMTANKGSMTVSQVQDVMNKIESLPRAVKYKINANEVKSILRGSQVESVPGLEEVKQSYRESKTSWDMLKPLFRDRSLFNAIKSGKFQDPDAIQALEKTLDPKTIQWIESLRKTYQGGKVAKTIAQKVAVPAAVGAGAAIAHNIAKK